MIKNGMEKGASLCENFRILTISGYLYTPIPTHPTSTPIRCTLLIIIFLFLLIRRRLLQTERSEGREGRLGLALGLEVIIRNVAGIYRSSGVVSSNRSAGLLPGSSKAVRIRASSLEGKAGCILHTRSHRRPASSPSFPFSS